MANERKQPSNVVVEENEGVVTIMIDTTKPTWQSASGESDMIASTHGSYPLGEYTLSLNFWKKRNLTKDEATQVALRKLAKKTGASIGDLLKIAQEQDRQDKKVLLKK